MTIKIKIAGLLFATSLLLSTLISQPEEIIVPENKGIAVIELFTSQGCSSCPSADKLLSEIIDNSSKNDLPVFGLSFHVDYWNRLGWKDPYSSKAFTDRQYAYARKLNSRSVYTPQMIVNGNNEFVGSNKRTASSAIRTGLANTDRDIISSGQVLKSKNRLGISFEIDGEVENKWLNIALVQRDISTKVPRGENRGRTLHHDNVVRAFQQVQADAKGMVYIQIPEGIDLEKSQVILYTQNQNTFEVEGATKLKL